MLVGQSVSKNLLMCLDPSGAYIKMSNASPFASPLGWLKLQGEQVGILSRSTRVYTYTKIATPNLFRPTTTLRLVRFDPLLGRPNVCSTSVDGRLPRHVGGKDPETKNCFVMLCIYTYIYRKNTHLFCVYILDVLYLLFIEKETHLFVWRLLGIQSTPKIKVVTCMSTHLEKSWFIKSTPSSGPRAPRRRARHCRVRH